MQDRDLLEKVQRLVPLAQEQQCTLSQLALAWVLRRTEVTSCIIGATRPAQVEENAEASGIQLDAETAARMEEILGKGVGLVATGQCPAESLRARYAACGFAASSSSLSSGAAIRDPPSAKSQAAAGRAPATSAPVQNGRRFITRTPERPSRRDALLA